ncbi:AraC family transcriptional regulator, activator of mtrCDE [Cupriavidus sp. YR651]|uniref:AraC family transcriptional regulator n=1 Tax=Cupriavidus sp. YR651 TaxID=1855315 RepID=UPI00088065B0|nr:AraC family transcriptional regulator [Cupriavidus sp. YR651]SDD99346.1 AraC family transcriptional regulator, activator of mtrCDE [Cupriavidus sp. YR651]
MNKGAARQHRDPPLARISGAQLDGLLSALSVEFVRLTECLVSPGWRLNLGGTPAPGIHYNLSGHGRMVLEGHPAIELLPHTLVITPPNQYFHIEVPPDGPESGISNEVEGRWKPFPPGAIRRFVAGDHAPQLMLICGYFEASYGTSVNLFSTLTAPIVEQFDSARHIDHTLRLALQELIDQEVGTGAMTATLLKVVLIALLRRSLTSIDLWVERFSLMGDANIARAFSHMAARPGAQHSVDALARTACLSRSSFMARFTEVVGLPPMTVLRRLRMRQAASMLITCELSVDHIARTVGYTSRSSFLKAFHDAYGTLPSDYRAQGRTKMTSKTENEDHPE